MYDSTSVITANCVLGHKEYTPIGVVVYIHSSEHYVAYIKEYCTWVEYNDSRREVAPFEKVFSESEGNYMILYELQDQSEIQKHSQRRSERHHKFESRGLVNHGKSCFLGALLQCMRRYAFHWAINVGHDKGTMSTFARKFALLLNEMSSTGDTPIHIDSFRFALTEQCNMFPLNKAGDPNEAFLYIILACKSDELTQLTVVHTTHETTCATCQ